MQLPPTGSAACTRLGRARLLAIGALLALIGVLPAQTREPQSTEQFIVPLDSGSWEDASLWPEGRVPPTGSSVRIPAGLHLHLGADLQPDLDRLQVEGELLLAPGFRLRLRELEVAPEGRVEGRSGLPSRIALTGPSPRLRVAGRLELEGRTTTTAARILTKLTPGSRSFVLDRVPRGWHPGLRLAVAPSRMGQGCERVRIAEIRGRRILVDAPGIRGAHPLPPEEGLGLEIAALERSLELLIADDARLSVSGELRLSQVALRRVGSSKGSLELRIQGRQLPARARLHGVLLDGVSLRAHDWEGALLDSCSIEARGCAIAVSASPRARIEGQLVLDVNEKVGAPEGPLAPGGGHGFHLEGLRCGFRDNRVAGAAGCAFVLRSRKPTPDPRATYLPDADQAVIAVAARLEGLRASACRNALSLRGGEVPLPFGTSLRDFAFWEIAGQGIEHDAECGIRLEQGLVHAADRKALTPLEPRTGIRVLDGRMSPLERAGLWRGVVVQGWEIGASVEAERPIGAPRLATRIEASRFDANAIHLESEERIASPFAVDRRTRFLSPVTLARKSGAPVAFVSRGIGGTGVAFDATRSAPRTSGLKIVSHRWEFGDGTTGFGLAPRHRYPRPGRYEVILETRDENGERARSRRPLVVRDTPFPDAVVNPPFFAGRSRAFSSARLFCDGSWWSSDQSWELEQGELFVAHPSRRPAFLRAAVRDDHLHRGVQRLSFEVANEGPGAEGNRLELRVLGYDGPFRRGDEASLSSRAAGCEGRCTVLLELELGHQRLPLQRMVRYLDLGEGYETLVFEWVSKGVAPKDGDIQGFRNLSLRGVEAAATGK